MSGEDTDITGLLSEKGVLNTLFSTNNGLLNPTEIQAAMNALRARIERKNQDRDNEKRRDQQKQEKPNSEKTQELAMQTMLTEIARTIEANNERLRVLERQQDALGKHLALLLAGEPVELSEDGSLKDADAEAAVKDYEEAKNITVDRTDPVQIQAAHDYGGEQIQSVNNVNNELEQLRRETAGPGNRNDNVLSNSGSQDHQGIPAGPSVDAPKP